MLKKTDLRFFCCVDHQVCPVELRGDSARIILHKNGYTLAKINNLSEEMVLVNLSFDGLFAQGNELAGLRDHGSSVHLPFGTNLSFPVRLTADIAHMLVEFYNDCSGLRQIRYDCEGNIKRFKKSPEPFCVIRTEIVRGQGVWKLDGSNYAVG